MDHLHLVQIIKKNPNFPYYHPDEGGVFKAKNKHRETEGAQEVEDTRDTHVDLPIDQVEAEEVKVGRLYINIYFYFILYLFY